MNLNKTTELNILFMMLNKSLRPIARKHSSIIMKRFRGSDSIKSIVNCYNSDEEITVPDLELAMKAHFPEPILKEYIKCYTDTIGLGEVGLNPIIEQFKKLIGNYLLSDESYANNPLNLIKAVQDYDFEFKEEESKIRIDEYDMSQLSMEKIKEDFGTPIKSSISAINKAFIIGGYIRHQLVCVVAPPSVGKSLFLMNESIRFVLDGNRVTYVALGDLTRYDFAVRCISIALGAKLNDVSSNLDLYWSKYKNFMGDKLKNFRVVNMDAGAKTSKELCDYLDDKGYVKDSDIIIIDYDTNLKSSEEMYKKGEEIYNEFVNLAKRVQLVMIASQPKINFYEEPLIPQSAAAESARKSQIVDVMITIGKNIKSSTPIGMMNLAKVRRGGRSEAWPYMINQSGRFSCIDKQTYHAIEHSDNIKTDPNASIKNDISLEEMEDEMKKARDVSEEVKKEMKTTSKAEELSVDDIAKLMQE